MNNALTTDDLADLVAIKAGATNPDGSRRNLRKSEIDDGGDRLMRAGLVSAVGPASSYLELHEDGEIELSERGL